MKTEKRRTLKGSVLFTVVSVLSLMIIFMTSALALAAAANKRAHRTYSSSQATYTARAAIDSILAAAGTNVEFSKAIATVANNGAPIDIKIDINDPALGKIENATVSYDGTTEVYDTKAQAWVSKNLLRITAEVTLGGETTRVASRIVQDLVQESPNSNNPAFLQMGGEKAFNSNGGIAFGGTYFGMSYGYNNGGQGTLKFINYNANDLVKPMTVLNDKLYLTQKTFDIKNEFIVEAPAVINGTVDSNTITHFLFSRIGNGVSIWGDYIAKNNGNMLFTSANLAKNLGKSPRFSDIPFLYVDQQFKLVTGGLTEDGNAPLNIFCGNFDINGGAINIGADIFCMDQKESVLKAKGSTLYNFASSIADSNTGYSSMGGGITSRGSIKIEGDGKYSIGGDLRCEGDLTIGAKTEVSVKGDIIVGGKLKIEGSGSDAGKITFAGSNQKVYAGNVEIAGIKAEYGDLKEGYTKKEVDATFVKDVKIDEGTGAGLQPATIWAKNYIVDKLNLVTKKENLGGKERDVLNGNGADATKYYIEKCDQNDIDKGKKYTAYYDKNGKEVEPGDATKSAGYTYGSHKISAIDDYKGKIYPDYARREILINAYDNANGKIMKGTELYISPAKPSDTITQECNKKVYLNQASVVGSVDQSCVFTGEFNKIINIKTKGEDINVIIKDMTFKNDSDKKQCRFTVDDSEGGKVTFYYTGTNKCEYPLSSDKDAVLKTVPMIIKDWQDTNMYNAGDADETPPDTLKTLTTADYDTFTDYDGVSYDGLEIDEDVCLKGTFTANNSNNKKFERFIVKAPAQGDRWVVLDDFTSQAVHNDGEGYKKNTIVIDDLDDNGNQLQGKVKFYIKGDCQLNGLWIVTRSFIRDMESNDKLQAFSDGSDDSLAVTYDDIGVAPPTGMKSTDEVKYLTVPRVEMYGDVGAKLQSNSGAFLITAFIKSTRLMMDMKGQGTKDISSLVNRLYYDGVPLSAVYANINKDDVKRIGVLGCINVYDFDSQNGWGFIYLSPRRRNEGGGNGGGNVGIGAHTYAAVEYFTY